MTRPLSSRGVLPLACLVPAVAIAVAFSLGPSPRKRLESFYGSARPDAAALAHLSAGGEPVLRALTEDVQRSDSPHRAVVIRFLSEQGYAPALPALERIVVGPREPVALRAAALNAMKALDPAAVRRLARGLREEAGALGRAAREALSDLGEDSHASLPRPG